MQADFDEYTIYNTLQVTLYLLRLFCSTGGLDPEEQGYCLPKLAFANLTANAEQPPDDNAGDLCQQLTALANCTVVFETSLNSFEPTEVAVGCCVMEVIDFYEFMSAAFYYEAYTAMMDCPLNSCQVREVNHSILLLLTFKYNLRLDCLHSLSNLVGFYRTCVEWLVCFWYDLVFLLAC